MITVSFFKEGDTITRVRAIGHSGYAESGNDIVCAAVSALIQTAYLAIKDLGSDVKYARDGSKAMFEFSVGASEEKRHDIDVILRAMRIGIDDLRSGYPQNIKTEIINGR